MRIVAVEWTRIRVDMHWLCAESKIKGFGHVSVVFLVLKNTSEAEDFKETPSIHLEAVAFEI